ncbi:hypothetical protein MIMGU_mgv1a021263mg, partial [Erythranthe guttata]
MTRMSIQFYVRSGSDNIDQHLHLLLQHFFLHLHHTLLFQVEMHVKNKEASTIRSHQQYQEAVGEYWFLIVWVFKTLWGRRYLVVIDDIWSVDAWDKVNLFFPENGQGSRIMITTRLSNATSISSHGLVMNFLNEDKIWDLLCRYVFEEEEDCPPELEKIGKKIAKISEGLPLSIVVIGGHLAKSKRTREHWEYISENINTIVNFKDDERCLKVLQLSYNHLPVHRKPCFLYMGVFPEDTKIRVSWLVKLWVSEGFVKPINDKSLDVVSKEYLQELCDRNLILVHKRGSYGNIKFCSIHYLLTDLCLREAEREDYHPDSVLHTLQYVPLVRSLISNFEDRLPLLDFRLLRVLKTNEKPLFEEIGIQNEYSLEIVFWLVNLRVIAIRSYWPENFGFPSSVNLLWNLQILIVNGTWDVVAPYDELVLGNLHTLTHKRNFKCGEEV